jgi:hypothetical protein
MAETKQISSQNYDYSKTQNQFAETEHKYQIAKAEG